MFIKALADAGTSFGLDEKSSLLYAEQTVFGSAKLAMESGKAPDELKKEVCSPGGTTIEGVKSLEKDGLAEIVHSAAEASYRAGGQSMRREIAKEPQKSFIFRNIKGER